MDREYGYRGIHPLTVILLTIFEPNLPKKLRKVILEDQLGICSELDAMMDNLINTYEDEWANVVNGLCAPLFLKHNSK